MSNACCPGQNQLLAAFPEQELNRLWKHFDQVTLSQGELLRQAGSGVQYACFPTSALVSGQYLLENGVSAEFSLIGSDGMVGIAGFLGGGTASGSALVIATGQAWRVRDDLLHEVFERDAGVRLLLLRYAQALITQIGQTAVCNRHHTVEQQLFRSLLGILDRSESSEIAMTHELLARRLGVRREGVSEAAYKAQTAGLIRYQRGRITVLDRAGLEARVCECYRTTKRECARLVPPLQYASGCEAQDCASCAGAQNLDTGIRSRRHPAAVAAGMRLGAAA